MKTRTSPHCGYKYSRIEYIKRLSFKTIWSKWDCPKCEQEITIENKRRFIVAILFGFWTYFLMMATIYFTMNLILSLLFFVAFLLGSIFIFTFDNFTKTDKHG